MLAADVPYFEVDVGQVDSRDILTDGGDRVELWVEMRTEQGFDLFKQGRLSGIVEAKEENRVFLVSRQPKSKARRRLVW